MRYVPEEEAQEVRELLEDNNIEYFETSAGNWGISVPAIWTKRDSQFSRAREIIDEYQKQRTQQIRQEFELIKQRGEAQTIWHKFLENPVRFIIYVGLIFLVLYVSLRLFLFF